VLFEDNASRFDGYQPGRQQQQVERSGSVRHRGSVPVLL
jgi:hypothetical protein